MTDPLSVIYQEMIEEKVTPADFVHYKEDDFVDVDDEHLDFKYAHIEPNFKKISLRDYNEKQLEALKNYFRSKMSVHKDASDEDMMKFIKRLILDHPEVMKKTRLHLAALEPELFDYIR